MMKKPSLRNFWNTDQLEFHQYVSENKSWNNFNFGRNFNDNNPLSYFVFLYGHKIILKTCFWDNLVKSDI